MAGQIGILGFPVDLAGRDAVERRVGCWLDDPAGGLRHVVTVNPEYLMAARRSRKFAHVLRAADLALADGVGLLVAARLLRRPVPPRITGNDLVEMVAGLAHPNKRVFLLGAMPGVAHEAAAVLRERYPEARIVGAYPGDPSPAGWPSIEARLAESRPTVLFVAFGHPKQDLWIATYRERLAEHGILVASGIGGVYDYLSGRVPRAPALMRRLGLEWLYRLIRQPWRWRRQLVLPCFVLLVLAEAITSRFGRGRAH